jgi:chromosome segregation ATPase
MSNAEKPREWRLRKGLISFPEDVDVIEKSAYDAVVKERDGWKDIAETRGQNYTIVKQERDEAKAAFEIAKKQMVLALEDKCALAAQLANMTKDRDTYKQEWHLMQNTPGPLFDKCERLERELAEAKALHDMDALIMSGLRGVLAIARMINNARPDARMTGALAAYDKSPLPASDHSRIERLEVQLAEAKSDRDKEAATVDHLTRETKEQYERIERLERALAYAKELILLEGGIDKVNRRLKEIERLERGE